MYTLNILLLNVTGLNSAVKQTCVLEYLHRKSISGALICNAASSGIFFFMCFGSVLLSWICGRMYTWFCLPHCGLIALLIQVCVFLKLNAKEKAVCWFCGCEEDDDVELV